MKIPNSLFSDLLSLNEEAIGYELINRVRAIAPHKAMLETHDYDFLPYRFAQAAGCSLLSGTDEEQGHWTATWINGTVQLEPRSAVLEVEWQGIRLTLIRTGDDYDSFWVIVGDSIAECERFFATVCRWVTDPMDSVIVFDNGQFVRDDALREQIQQFDAERIHTSAGLREQLDHSMRFFFDQKEMYEKYGLPWKRGVIMYGPPGNGKTQTIRSLVKELGKPTIYVRSLRTDYRSGVTQEECIRQIFKRAAQIAPCIIVFEDIDSMIDKNNKSAFLNELDGIRGLNGVLTIATTNHLDTLDPAIANRPNRFDVKIEYANPAEEDRLAYLTKAFAELSSLLSPSTTKVAWVASALEDVSYAHLKELVTNMLMLVTGGLVPDMALQRAYEILFAGKPSKKKKSGSKGSGSKRSEKKSK